MSFCEFSLQKKKAVLESAKIRIGTDSHCISISLKIKLSILTVGMLTSGLKITFKRVRYLFCRVSGLERN